MTKADIYLSHYLYPERAQDCMATHINVSMSLGRYIEYLQHRKDGQLLNKPFTFGMTDAEYEQYILFDRQSIDRIRTRPIHSSILAIAPTGVPVPSDDMTSEYRQVCELIYDGKTLDEICETKHWSVRMLTRALHHIVSNYK